MLNSAIVLTLAAASLALCGCATRPVPRASVVTEATEFAAAFLDDYDALRFDSAWERFYWATNVSEADRAGDRDWIVGSLEILAKHLGPTRMRSRVADCGTSARVTVSPYAKDWREALRLNSVVSNARILVEFADAGPGCWDIVLLHSGAGWTVLEFEISVPSEEDNMFGALDEVLDELQALHSSGTDPAEEI